MSGGGESHGGRAISGGVTGEELGRASSECSLTILPYHEDSQVLSLESCH